MTHAAEGSFLIISTSLATLRPLVNGMKKHVTKSIVSRDATRHQSSGAKSAPRTNASHVDVMDYMPLSVQGYGSKIRETSESGTTSVEECKCQRGDTIALDGKLGVCVDCGGQKSRRHKSTGITWVEMLNG